MGLPQAPVDETLPVAVAFTQEDRRLIEEIADLTYHTLVLLAERGLKSQEVLAELEKRRNR